MLKPILCLFAALLVAAPALADPPGHAKGGKGGGRQGHGGNNGLSIDININTSDRTVIQDYYGDVFRSGKCPPGLAKKNNGCMPPGQAKKWGRGMPLPRDVVFYDLPPELSLRLHAPAGAKYVRVAADVLLIAVGTGMVLDAVEDLSRM